MNTGSCLQIVAWNCDLNKPHATIKMKFHDFSMISVIFPKIHDFSRPGKCIFKFHDFS